MTPGEEILQLISLTPGGTCGVGMRRDVLLGLDEPNPEPFSGGEHSNWQPIDTIMAASWQLDLEPGTSSTIKLQTHYSAAGEQAVPVTLTSSEGGDGESTVTASFGTEDAPAAVSGGPRITLPAGTSYVEGSSTIGEPIVVGDVLMFAAPVGSTDTSFSFRVAGGEAGVVGDLELVGSTADGVDYVQTTLPIEIAPFTPEPSPTPTPTLAPTSTPTASVSASPTATATTSATASASATTTPASTPPSGALATTGVDSNLAPLGIGAGVIVLLGAGLAMLALRRRSKNDAR